MPICIHKKIEEKTPQKTCVSEKMANFAVANRARGVIGSRARLRIWCLTTWGFESLRAHNNQASFPGSWPDCFYCPLSYIVLYLQIDMMIASEKNHNMAKKVQKEFCKQNRFYKACFGLSLPCQPLSDWTFNGKMSESQKFRQT